MTIIIENLDLPKECAAGIALTLGNFDGVHLGHQAILKNLREIAEKEKMPSVVMTFEPHPVSHLRPDLAPFRITSPKQKAKLIGESGVDILLSIKFDQPFAEISGEDFVKNILIEKLNVKYIVIGYDCNFGRGRAGNAEYLEKMAKEFGIGFTKVEIQKKGADFVSSSNIRNFIKEGKIKEAEALLGHPFEITGKVMEGNKKGRLLGFPTANLSLENYIHPRFGVYEALTQIGQENTWHKSIANIGIKPTIQAEKPLLEVHILDFDLDIYGKEIKVRLGSFIRDEKKFNTLAELKNQITLDIQKIN